MYKTLPFSSNGTQKSTSSVMSTLLVMTRVKALEYAAFAQPYIGSLLSTMISCHLS